MLIMYPKLGFQFLTVYYRFSRRGCAIQNRFILVLLR